MTRIVGSTHFPALGTTAVVLTADPGALALAVDAVQETVEAIDLACSRFRPDSALSNLNRAAGQWRCVDPLLFEAIDVAVGAARATEGAVDPTVGNALVQLGYDRDFAGVPRTGPKLQPSVPAPGWRCIELDPVRAAVRVPPGVLLDLGATAKALAADRAAVGAATVAGCGVLVSLGGDLSTCGAPPDGGWTVEIADEHPGLPSPGRTVGIRSGGLATSSTMVRRWRRGDEAVHHVVDPRTGRSAVEVWQTVTVAAATCVDANTATTAAIVRGEEAVEWLRMLGVPARLVRPDGRVVRVCGWPDEEAA